MPTTIGFIGLGSMGREMCLRLLAADHVVHGYARRAQVLAPLVSRGARPSLTPAAAARSSEIVCINVTGTADVEEVLFGPDGVAQGGLPGTTVLDFSTISPLATKTFADRLQRVGIDMLDCPVSGGVQGARSGTLSIMVGGAPHVFERVRPILSILGSTLTHVGDHGAGQVAKACNQIIQVVNIQGIAEAVYFARATGLDFLRILPALQAGFAGSRMLDLMGPKMSRRDFKPGMEARLHAKDFDTIATVANALATSMPAVSLVGRQLHALLDAGWGSEDTSTLLKVLEAMSESGSGRATAPPD